MNRGISTGLLCVFTLIHAGCATRRVGTVRLDEPWRGEFQPIRYGTLPSSGPERSHNALLAAFREDTVRGKVECIGHANAVLGRWPHHPYATSSCHLAGWSVLFHAAERRTLPADESFSAWEAYVDSLLTASFYFERSARNDRTIDGFWTSAAAMPLGIIHRGFLNTEALRLYLLAKRLTKITYPKTQHESTLVETIRVLKVLQRDHPDWAEDFGVSELIHHTLGALTVKYTREEEEKEIFGQMSRGEAP